MRLGFFGGSFDPPHRGHLAVARAALITFNLDRVLLAPAALQPLKRDHAEASFVDRLRMVELLCDDASDLQSQLAASSVDGPLPDHVPNYTIDTLARLRSTLTPGTELFLIVGADSFLAVRQWRSAEDLLNAAEWIVVSRPGFDLGSLDSLGLTDSQRARVHLLGGVAEPVSATEARARLREHDDCTDLVPGTVLAYIYANHLYGT